MTLKKILVPLDGSPTAEAAVPAAVSLARDTRGTLLLLSVAAPPSRERPEPAHGEAVSTAEAYLARTRDRLRADGVTADTAVWFGTPAAAIVAAADATQSDLIVMTTHGRSGPERDVFGSVTESVLHGTRRPVLVVHPEPAPIRPPAGQAQPAARQR